MRIAVDATPLTAPTGGVRRYTEELGGALAAAFPDDDIYLLSDQEFETRLLSFSNVHRGAPPHSRLERKWWLWGIRRELSRIGADLFHGVDFSVPYLPLHASVMTVHDLSPWREATAAATSERVRRRTPALVGLGLATMVITPTRTVRNEAVEHFHAHPDRIVSIPLAASDRFRPMPVPVERRPYFLYVGTIESRKNIGLVLEAWREVRRTNDVEFWLAGRVRDEFHAPADESGLRRLGAVGDEQLPELYSGALACVYPSLYEGFGLPVLEAMQCGAMVIASEDPAISEVAGGAALQVGARDGPGWREALATALDPSVRACWSDRGLRRAAEFSWERTARLTREVYEEARRRF